METKEVGMIVYTAINTIMAEKKIKQEEFMKKLGRKPELFVRFLYDVKNGNMTMQSLLKIADALDVKVWDIINEKYYMEESDKMITLLMRGKVQFNSGDIVDIPELLGFIWTTLSFGDRKKIGKEIYADVLNGRYASIISFHHKNSNNHAYYVIV